MVSLIRQGENNWETSVSGFLHLERCKVLHRDIRPLNILVSNDSELKIIDFGFGKQAGTKKDFDKSISLNWWCEPPMDFSKEQYNFQTEIYFVGKLFEKIIKEREIGTFIYTSLLSKMCAHDPQEKIQSFYEVNSSISENKFFEVEFNESELEIYRDFSRSLESSIAKIESECKYFQDTEFIQKKLEECYRSVMLEEYVPSNGNVTRCFLNGSYYFSKHNFFPVIEIKAFIELLRSCSVDKKNIIVDNLYSKLDAIDRYTLSNDGFDDVPF